MASLLQNIRGNSNIVTKLQKQEIRAKFFQKCICIEQIYYISKLSISGVTLHGGRHYLRQQPFYFIGILFLPTIESFKSYPNLSTYIMIIGPDLGKLYGLIIKKFMYDMGTSSVQQLFHSSYSCFFGPITDKNQMWRAIMS